MLSARAGEEGTVEGLEAGADDYLVKPFSARELLARVRANLELDRVRRARDQLETQPARCSTRRSGWRASAAGSSTCAPARCRPPRSSSASWGSTPEELAASGLEDGFARIVHPDDRRAGARRDRAGPQDRRRSTTRSGSPRSDGARAVPDARRGRARRRRAAGPPARLATRTSPSSAQAEQALAAAAAERRRPRRASTRSPTSSSAACCPRRRSTPTTSTSRRTTAPGVEGTQVGGDWYDVIELGAGRTALVVGDVMGRGVRRGRRDGPAAARPCARTPGSTSRPPTCWSILDGLVRDLGDDQIVTCVYAVYDPRDRRAHVRQRRSPAAAARRPRRRAARRLEEACRAAAGRRPFTLVEERR